MPIRNEFRSYIPNVGHGRTIEFECNSGYSLHGPSGLTCNHGRWMPSEQPRCTFGKFDFKFFLYNFCFWYLENHVQPNIIFTG